MAENLSGITQPVVNDYEPLMQASRDLIATAQAEETCLTLSHKEKEMSRVLDFCFRSIGRVDDDFLFIAIIYAKDADKRATAVTEVVFEWQQLEEDIYNALESGLARIWKMECRIEKIH